MKIPSSIKEGFLSGVILGAACIIFVLVALQTAAVDPTSTPTINPIVWLR